MVSFVSWILFNRDICTVKLALNMFACLKDVRSRSTWNFVLHETVVFLDIDLGSFISPHVNVGYRIVL